jgi:hypothetical protein
MIPTHLYSQKAFPLLLYEPNGTDKVTDSTLQNVLNTFFLSLNTAQLLRKTFCYDTSFGLAKLKPTTQPPVFVVCLELLNWKYKYARARAHTHTHTLY